MPLPTITDHHPVMPTIYDRLLTEMPLPTFGKEPLSLPDFELDAVADTLSEVAE